MTLRVKSESETASEAAKLAGKIRPGTVILLRGDLGSGKTVFARALIRALTGNNNLEIPSPTFTLVQNYDSSTAQLWHFDLYRLKDPEEIYELGWDEALSGEDITLIEWPEIIEHLIPPGALDIHIEAVENEPGHRDIGIKSI